MSGTALSWRPSRDGRQRPRQGDRATRRPTFTWQAAAASVGRVCGTPPGLHVVGNSGFGRESAWRAAHTSRSGQWRPRQGEREARRPAFILRAALASAGEPAARDLTFAWWAAAASVGRAYGVPPDIHMTGSNCINRESVWYLAHPSLGRQRRSWEGES